MAAGGIACPVRGSIVCFHRTIRLWGLQLVPGKWLGLYMLNLVAPIITTFRYAVFGFGYFDLTYYQISWAIALLVFFIGLVLFSRIERTFMDTI